MGAMNGDIQAAAKFLADLREAYRGLPKHIQLRLTYLLRERILQKHPATSARADAPGVEAITSIFKARF
jgi:hypothetical protein